MRTTKAIVSLGAIRRNVERLGRCAQGAEVMAVVKADGYGHGAVRVAKAALSAGAAWLCVATLEEGVALRQAGIKAPILVMGVLTPEECAQCVFADLSACVFLPEQIYAMHRAAASTDRQALAHLKVETGFHRIGAGGPALEEMLCAFDACPSVHMQGMFTHFATADMKDDTFVLEQLDLFHKALATIRAHGYAPKTHVSNSAATLRRGRLEGDMVRLGIAMYGCVPSEEMPMPVLLEPALKWVSAIGAINRLAAGETVGYGRTFTAKKPSVIATLPVGYADGYARSLGGRAHVLVHGQICPVVSRVCMDQTMVDITHIRAPKLGDEVVLLGSQGENSITAGDIAGWIGSIDYEVLVRISKRVMRTYSDG